jgi:hypothetical protein
LAWIELHNSIWTHPKIKPLAEALNIDRMLAAAYLIRFWTWAIEHIECVDGEITHLSYEDISAAAGWRKSADKFVEALIRSHWFDRKDEKLYIHDWNDFAGRLIRKRISDRERKRNNNSDDIPQEIADNSDGIPTEFAASTVPNRTIDTNVSLCPNTNSDENTKKRKTPIFDHESDPYRLAAELSRMIHENNAAAKQQTERDLQRWAKAIELMLRLDKRTAEQAWSVMKFSQQDVFWKSIILSPDNLRKHFDTLTLKTGECK